MSNRYKPNQKRARKQFTKFAMRTASKNIAPPPMRGGYRI